MYSEDKIIEQDKKEILGKNMCKNKNIISWQRITNMSYRPILHFYWNVVQSARFLRSCKLCRYHFIEPPICKYRVLNYSNMSQTLERKKTQKLNEA
jgi:hypothetical protein